jgi:flagellar L-ring protein precursor FlgH
VSAAATGGARGRRGPIAALLAAALLLPGCALLPALYPRVQVDDGSAADAAVAAAANAPPAAAPAAPTGAIFQFGAYRPLFEDHRARLPGDVLTVAIVEKIAASQSAKSTIGKTGTVEAAVSALPGIPAKALARATASGTSNNAFDGKGSTESSNDFSGTITATVRQVLPNGHLVIVGEKQIGVNANVDVLRFSGQVDPRTIQPGNVVQSAQVANVRLEQRGRGAQADAQAIGWLARVFLSVLPI